MEAFEKVINPGRTAEGQVFVKIEWDGKRLSLSGVVGPLKSGNAKGGCGQIAEELFAIQTYAKGWTHENSWRLVELWRLWHLNDMRAVPGDVLEELSSFPDTTKQPAWV